MGEANDSSWEDIYARFKMGLTSFGQKLNMDSETCKRLIFYCLHGLKYPNVLVLLWTKTKWNMDCVRGMRIWGPIRQWEIIDKKEEEH